MKAYKIILIGLFFLSVLINLGSCTPEKNSSEDYLSEDFTDKDKVCPPHDRNCNGIPDDQE